MPIRKSIDWLGKSSAGLILGFTLAVAVSGLFAWAGPGGPSALNKYQMVMWLVVPVWMGALSAVFLFRSGLGAWLWLGGANALAYGALFLCRSVLR